MFNLVKDDFDENSDDILNTINKMLEKNEEVKKEKKEKKIPGLIDRKDVGEIYHVIESKLTEEEDE